MQAMWRLSGVALVAAMAGCGQGADTSSNAAANAANVPAATNVAAAPAPTAAAASVAVTIPFVGCPANGQLGPVAPPRGQPITLMLDPALAGKLAYYSATNVGAVLAPAGWHCFGDYGSDGANLFIAPNQAGVNNVSTGDWPAGAGPAVQASWMVGDTSGRFEVAKVISRLFPGRMAFAKSVIAEGIEPASDFGHGPFATDQLTRKGSNLVEYVTPAGAAGAGAAFSELKTGAAISGMAFLQGSTPDLVFLAARMPAGSEALAPVILRRLEADAGAATAAPPPSLAAAAPSPTAVAAEDPVSVVRAFYTALGHADGASASVLVVPEKRASGPFSAAALNRFYGAMRPPIGLSSAAPNGDGSVSVRYHYVYAGGRVCNGAAEVQTTTRGGQTLISGIRAAGC